MRRAKQTEYFFELPTFFLSLFLPSQLEIVSKEMNLEARELSAGS